MSTGESERQQSKVEDLILQKLESIEQKMDGLVKSLIETDSTVAKIKADVDLKIAQLQADVELKIAQLRAEFDKRLCDLESFKRAALWLIGFLIVTTGGGGLAFIWGVLTHAIEIKSKAP
jgi:hypothetical protein